MINDERRNTLRQGDETRERHQFSIKGRHIDPRQIARIALQLRIDLNDDFVLIAVTIDGRELALGESVFECVIDVADRDVETLCRVAVYVGIELKAALLAVRRHVDDTRNAADGRESFGNPIVKSVVQ